MKKIRKLLALFMILAISVGYAKIVFAETMSQATSISLNKKYEFTMKQGEQKFFKIKVSESGGLDLYVQSDYFVKYCLVDASGESQTNAIYTEYNSNLGDYTRESYYRLCAGTYYIKIWNVDSGSNTFGFSFKTKFYPSEESFAETWSSRYNSISTAKEIQLGTLYNGYLTGNSDHSFPDDDYDVYKFNVSTTGTYRIHTERNPYDFRILFVNSNDEEIKKYWHDTSDGVAKELDFNLEKGTYYIQIYSSNERKYRLKISQVPPTISTQPNNCIVKSEETAEFIVKSDSYNVRYQWQQSSDGGKTWKTSTASGNKTTTLRPKGSETTDGYKYRCKVYVGSKYKFSKVVTLKVRPSIITQPKSRIITHGGTAKYTIESGFSSAKYQWQISTDGGRTWADSGATGNKTTTLSVSAAANHDGNYYRCKITSKSGANSYSKAVILKVKPKITLQPKDVTVKRGTTAVFTANATGANLKFQWQISSDGGKTWHNTTVKGNKTKKITIQTKADQNGKMYRCVVSNGSVKAYTDPAKLTVK